MAAATRLASINIVRGIVMVLMAIDHVGVYPGVPEGRPLPGVFFTRCVTHFCEPVFVYYPCRRYAAMKSAGTHRWMRYI